MLDQMSRSRQGNARAIALARSPVRRP